MEVIAFIYLSRFLILETSLLILKRNTQISYSRRALIIFFVISLALYVPFYAIYFLHYFIDLYLLYWLFSKSQGGNQGFWPKIFMVLYSRVLTEIAGRFFILNIVNLFYPSISQIIERDGLKSTVVILFQCLFAILTNELFVKFLRVDFGQFQKLNEKRSLLSLFRMSSLLLFIYYCAQWFSYITERYAILHGQSGTEIRQYSSLFVLFIFIFFVARLTQQVNEILEQEIHQQEQRQQQELREYTHHIESLYREIRTFRHDYTNLLVSLRYSLDQDDLDGVKKVYQEVLSESVDNFQDAKYDIGNLSLIDNDAIKSLLLTKLNKATSQRVAFRVEVINPIGAPRMPLVNFLRILGILLDNAIEAAKGLEGALVQVSYFEDRSKTVLMVRNNVADKPQSVPLKSLYEFGESSKGEGRGLGLANLKELIDKDPFINLITQQRSGYFGQILEIGNENLIEKTTRNKGL